MYDYQGEKSVGVPASPSVPLIQSIGSEFQDLNEQQIHTISAIEEKLHYIINKKNQEPVNNKEVKDAPILDFRDNIRSSMATLRVNTRRLNEVLNHLQDIA